MTKTPIEPGDIRKGDLIRKEYRVPLGVKTALEYVASFSGDAYASDKGTYFRLNRPKPYVTLPTEVGTIIVYKQENSVGKNKSVFAELMFSGEWRVNGFDLYSERMMLAELQNAPFTKLEPVAETAKRFAAELKEKIVKQIELQTNWFTAGTAGTIGRWATEIAADFGVTR